MKRLFAVLIFLSLCLVACSDAFEETSSSLADDKSSNSNNRESNGGSSNSNSNSAPLPASFAEEETQPEVDQGQPQNQGFSQRVVIKTAILDITVKDPAAKITEITQLAESNGGWVIQSNSNVQGDKGTGLIQIRIPAELFNDIMVQIKQNTIEVVSEQITGQDVTEEYTDLQSRITNLRASEERIRTFLESATDTNNVLRLNTELTTVQEQIETLQGRVNLYEESAAYSSITVNLFKEVPVVIEEKKEPAKKDTGWQLGKTFGEAKDSLIITLGFISKVLIWIVVFILPVILVVILFSVPLVYGWRWVNQRLSSNTAK